MVRDIFRWWRKARKPSLEPDIGRIIDTQCRYIYMAHRSLDGYVAVMDPLLLPFSKETAGDFDWPMVAGYRTLYGDIHIVEQRRYAGLVTVLPEDMAEVLAGNDGEQNSLQDTQELVSPQGNPSGSANAAGRRRSATHRTI